MTSFHDIELLSVYLDGQLNPSDSARLESRLVSDGNLRAVLNDLRSIRGILQELPKRRAPRSFVLSPKMAGVKPPLPRSYPLFRVATAVAAFLFLLTFAVNDLAPAANPHLAAAPPLGFGAVAPSVQESAPATGAPVQPFSALAPSDIGTPTGSKNSTRILGTPAVGIAPGGVTEVPMTNQTDPFHGNAAAQPAIPLIWQLVLGAVALFGGLITWMLSLMNDRKFRNRFGKK